MERIGTTTAQILGAAKGSVFVWCGGNAAHAKSLARYLGRDDLQVVSFQQAVAWGGAMFHGKRKPVTFDRHIASMHMTASERFDYDRTYEYLKYAGLI